MDLFTINRFTGEETVDAKTEEENKLSQVLKKIHKKKKRKLKAKSNTFNIEDREEQDSTLFKDDVLESTNTLEQTNESAGVDDELAQDEPSSKKQKIESNIPESTIADSFTILGTDKFDKKPIVRRVLPTWLRNPTVIATDLQKLSEKISRADLNENLKKRLKENKIKYLFPVQAGFIPWQMKKTKQSIVINPPDVCVSAPTGSGKTLAFTIPILQHLLDKLSQRNITIKAVRALLVLPTQSLATQIYTVFKSYSAGTDITVGVITPSKVTFKYEQKHLVTNNSVWGSTSRADVIVCTAGRLIDHLKNTKGFNLQHLEYLIIDEADRVLDSMQDDWLRHLGMHLRSERINIVGSNVLTLAAIKNRLDPQKLLFSATLSSDPEKLDKLSLFQPTLFTCVTNNENVESTDKFIGKYTTPNELIEKYITCTASVKPLVLYKLIMETVKNSESPKIIVFVNEKDTAHRLNTLLCFMSKKSFIVKEISDHTPKNIKNDLLDSFSSGASNVLICTNLIARGIDIPNVDCVISYSTPTHIKTYIHRAGRTARGGIKGVCITMLENHEERKFLKMLENVRSTISSLEKIQYSEDELESLSPLYKKSLKQLKFKVNSEKMQHLLKTKQRKQVFKPRLRKKEWKTKKTQQGKKVKTNKEHIGT